MTGDLVYVTVRVTTCRTLTGFCVAERGDSYILLIFSAFQSADEKGDRIELQLLCGESEMGDHIGDWGMRNRRRAVGVRAEFGGRMNGEGGIMGAEVAVFGGASWAAQGHVVALLGWVMGVVFPE